MSPYDSEHLAALHLNREIDDTFGARETEKYQKLGWFSQVRKYFYLPVYFNKCNFHEGKNPVIDGIISFKSVFTFYDCLNLPFKFCPQNHNERLFSVMHWTNQSSVNDIFWCLRFPRGKKSDFQSQKKKIKKPTQAVQNV